MYRYLLLTVLLFLPFHSFSQKESAEGVYTSLETAKRQPEEVITLKLKRKKLKEFPMEIFMFPNLKRLDLRSNKIRRIPENIGRLTRLEYLNLSNNKIEKIPESIGDLKQLEVLDLNRNDLISLPISIRKLTSLRELILWSNNIDTFPDEISELDGTLETLDMRSIQMNTEKQQIIKNQLPNVKKKFDYPCGCY